MVRHETPLAGPPDVGSSQIGGAIANYKRNSPPRFDDLTQEQAFRTLSRFRLGEQGAVPRNVLGSPDFARFFMGPCYGKLQAQTPGQTVAPLVPLLPDKARAE